LQNLKLQKQNKAKLVDEMVYMKQKISCNIKIRRSIFSFLFLIVFSIVFPQQKNTVIEDDYETLKGKIRLYFNSSTDRSLMYAQQMAKSSNCKHLAFANGVMTCLLQTKGQTKESQKKYKAAFYYLEKMPESREKIQLTSYIYNYGGIAEWSRGNLGKALENYQIALKFSTQINDIKQIVKIKGNIAIINEAVGNYQLAIQNQKSLIDFVDKNEDIYTTNELMNLKSNFNRGLGTAYESYFTKNISKKHLLDSAGYYYKKTIEYSESFIENKIVAQLCLGNVYNWKHDFINAEKMYRNAISLAKKSKQESILPVANYNLADIYFSRKNYIEALAYYKKSDSLTMLSGNPLNSIDYLKSNFYQAKIYTILKKPDLAYKHSKIYLENYEKYEAEISKETLEVNYKQGTDGLTAEMLSIEKRYKQSLFLSRALNIFYVLLFFGIVFLWVKNIMDKNQARKNMIALIEESKAGK
jgi:tetratricopeptide (TPR) repeat protein